MQTYGLDPNAVAEQTGGDPQTRYTFGLGYDTPLAMTTSSSSSAVFFEQDALSSVTSLTNTTGAIVGRATYDTYGQITTQTGQVSPYTYTGREHEPATGLYHYRARWYDPATGRFTSEDPVRTTNLYPYAGGFPISAKDPTGETFLAEVAESQTVMSVLANSFYSTVVEASKCDSTTGSRIKAAFGGAVGGLGGALVFRVAHWLIKPGIMTIRSGPARDWAARGALVLITAVGESISTWIADEIANGTEDPEARARAMLGGAISGAALYDGVLSDTAHALAGAAVVTAAVELGRGLLDPGADCE